MKYWRRFRANETLSIASGNVKWYNHLVKQFGSLLKKPHIIFSCDLAIPLLGIAKRSENRYPQ